MQHLRLSSQAQGSDALWTASEVGQRQHKPEKKTGQHYQHISALGCIYDNMGVCNNYESEERYQYSIIKLHLKKSTDQKDSLHNFTRCLSFAKENLQGSQRICARSWGP